MSFRGGGEACLTVSDLAARLALQAWAVVSRSNQGPILPPLAPQGPPGEGAPWALSPPSRVWQIQAEACLTVSDLAARLALEICAVVS